MDGGDSPGKFRSNLATFFSHALGLLCNSVPIIFCCCSTVEYTTLCFQVFTSCFLVIQSIQKYIISLEG